MWRLDTVLYTHTTGDSAPRSQMLLICQCPLPEQNTKDAARAYFDLGKNP